MLYFIYLRKCELLGASFFFMNSFFSKYDKEFVWNTKEFHSVIFLKITINYASKLIKYYTFFFQNQTHKKSNKNKIIHTTLKSLLTLIWHPDLKW